MPSLNRARLFLSGLEWREENWVYMGGVIAIASGSECGISWDECRRSTGVAWHWKMLHTNVTWEGWHL